MFNYRKYGKFNNAMNLFPSTQREWKLRELWRRLHNRDNISSEIEIKEIEPVKCLFVLLCSDEYVGLGMPAGMGMGA